VRPFFLLRARFVLAALTILAAGCGAPAARQATGDVARAVETSLASGAERFENDDWTRLLAGGTRDGLVDHDFMRRHRVEIDAYLTRVSLAPLARLAAGHLEALLVNAYNAYTIQSVLEHPRIASIKEIPGVWTETKHRVGGFGLTLDDIEHRLLRPFFKDPRIHFALNCASRSCAPLPPYAIEGDRIEAQLEERARVFLTQPGNVRVEGETLVLSKYFDWYGGDFTMAGWHGTSATVAAYVARYADKDIAAFIEKHHGEPPIRFAEYDWALNSAPPAAPSAPQDEAPAAPAAAAPPQS
jgi:hypothetical protein